MYQFLCHFLCCMMTRILLDYDNNSTSTSYFYFLWHVKKWAAAEKSHLRSVTVIVRSPEIRLFEIRTLNTALKSAKLQKKIYLEGFFWKPLNTKNYTKKISIPSGKNNNVPNSALFLDFRAIYIWYSTPNFSYLQSGRRLKGCTKLGNGSGRVESSSSTVHRKITHDFFRLPEFRAIIDHQLVSAMQLFLKKGIPQSRDIVCNYV